MSNMNSMGRWVVGRRDFLRAAGAVVALGGLGGCQESLRVGERSRGVRIGLVTDCHYADADTKGTRYYRDSLKKLAECVEVMNGQKAELLVEMGDFKDQNTPPDEARTLEYLRTIEGVFDRFDGPRYHVLGNHDMDSLSKTQFLANVANTGIDKSRSYYSFDRGGVHFVVLDACYTGKGDGYDHSNFAWTDANICSEELDWLQADLARTAGPVVVFVHQLLDGAGSYYIKNAADVRQVLQDSGNVLAVFQGHQHEGGYHQIEGIHYYTLKAVVEGPAPANNSFAIAEVKANLDITVTGYKNAVSRELPKA